MRGMLKPKVWVATAILTLLAVSHAWAQCECTVRDLKPGFALSMWYDGAFRQRYVENGDHVTLYGRKDGWDDIDRHRPPFTSGYIRGGHCQHQCGGFVGGTPRTPPPPPETD
jgi:hypothetical protein